MTQYVEEGHLGGYIAGGDSYTFCPVLWDALLREFPIKSMLDVGCAEGHAMRWFHNYGIEVHGVEGCQQAIDNHLMPDRVIKHDFTKSALRSPTVDLVWCCEVLEHVEQEHEAKLLSTIVSSGANVIAVTAARPGQPGYHHVNCQMPDYWITRMDALGYDHAAEWEKTKRTMFGEQLGFWFYHNGLLFTRR
jgi:hypothetical protein